MAEMGFRAFGQVLVACAPVAAATALLVGAAVGVAAGQTPAPGSGGGTVDAGFGRGVTIGSGDGTASLTVRARMQIRSTTSDTPDDERPANADVSIRRMRLVFQGNARGPALTYYVQLSFATLDTEADLRVPLRDAYVTWTVGRDATLRIGQMKVPFSRQRVVSSSAMQLVDRALVVGELNLDRDVGAQWSARVPGTGRRVGYTLGIFGGEGRNRAGRDLGYLYTARIEASPLRSFDAYSEADLRRDPAPRVAIGAGVGYNQNTNRPRSTIGDPYPAGDFDYRHAEVDAVFKQRGFSLTGELMYRGADTDRRTVSFNGAPITIASRSGWGGYIQGGQMLTARVEMSGRYGRLSPREGTADTLVPSHEFVAGASYYASEHNLKVQGDYTHLRATGAPRAGRQVRVQLQLFF